MADSGPSGPPGGEELDSAAWKGAASRAEKGRGGPAPPPPPGSGVVFPNSDAGT